MAETLDNLNKQIKNQKDTADKELKDEQSEAAVKAEKNKAVTDNAKKLEGAIEKADKEKKNTEDELKLKEDMASKRLADLRAKNKASMENGPEEEKKAAAKKADAADAAKNDVADAACAAKKTAGDSAAKAAKDTAEADADAQKATA